MNKRKISLQHVIQATHGNQAFNYWQYCYIFGTTSVENNYFISKPAEAALSMLAR